MLRALVALAAIAHGALAVQWSNGPTTPAACSDVPPTYRFVGGIQNFNARLSLASNLANTGTGGGSATTLNVTRFAGALAVNRNVQNYTTWSAVSASQSVLTWANVTNTSAALLAAGDRCLGAEDTRSTGGLILSTGNCSVGVTTPVNDFSQCGAVSVAMWVRVGSDATASGYTVPIAQVGEKLWLVMHGTTVCIVTSSVASIPRVTTFQSPPLGSGNVCARPAMTIGGFYVPSFPSSAWNAGGWNFVVFTFNKQSSTPAYTLFVNGVLMSMTTTSLVASPNVTDASRWAAGNASFYAAPTVIGAITSTYSIPGASGATAGVVLGDFQAYCGVDLAGPNAGGAAIALATGTATTVQCASAGAREASRVRFPNGPRTSSCAARAPTSWLVGNISASLFAGAWVAGASTSRTTVSYAPTALGLTLAGQNSFVRVPNLAAPYAVAMWIGPGTYDMLQNASGYVEYMETLLTAPGIALTYGAMRGVCLSTAPSRSVFVHTGSRVAAIEKAESTTPRTACASSPQNVPYVVGYRNGSAISDAWTHVLVSVASDGSASLFVNGQPAFRPGSLATTPTVSNLSIAVPVTTAVPSTSLDASAEIVVLGDVQVYARGMADAAPSLFHGVECDVNAPTSAERSQAPLTAPDFPPATPPVAPTNVTVFACPSADDSAPLHWFSAGATQNSGMSTRAAYVSSSATYGATFVSLTANTSYFAAPATYYGGANAVYVSAWVRLRPTYTAWTAVFAYGSGGQLAMMGQNITAGTGTRSFAKVCVVPYASVSASSDACPTGAIGSAPLFVAYNTWTHIAIASVRGGGTQLFVNGELGVTASTPTFDDLYGNAAFVITPTIGAQFSDLMRSTGTSMDVADLQITADATFPPAHMFGASRRCAANASIALDALALVSNDPSAGIVYKRDLSVSWAGPPFAVRCMDTRPVHALASIADFPSATALSRNDGAAGGSPLWGGITPVASGPLTGYYATAGQTAYAFGPAQRVDASPSLTVSSWIRRNATAPGTANHYPVLMVAPGVLVTFAPRGATGFALCVVSAPTWLRAPLGNATACGNPTFAARAAFSSPAVVTPLGPDSNNWIHVAATLASDGTVAIYANGAAVASGLLSNVSTFSTQASQLSGLYIPSWREDGGIAFADVQVYANVSSAGALYFGTSCGVSLAQYLNAHDAYSTDVQPLHSYLGVPVGANDSSVAYSTLYANAGLAGMQPSLYGNDPWKLSSQGTDAAVAVAPGKIGISDQANVQFLAGDYGVTGDGVSVTARTFAFWVYRLPNVVARNASRFLTVPERRGYAYSIEVNLARSPTFVNVIWPGCPGASFFSQRADLNTTGMHHVVVTFPIDNDNSDIAGNIAVFIDGERASQGAARDLTGGCSIDTGVWPARFISTGATLGTAGSGGDVGVFSLVHFSVYSQPFTESIAEALWTRRNIRGVRPGNIAVPPPPYSAPSLLNSVRLTACFNEPPEHRFGTFQAYPFVNGELVDGGALADSDPWNAPWVSSTFAMPQANTSQITLVKLPSLSAAQAAIDFGTRNIASLGLTILFYVQMSSPCNATVAAAHAPSSMAFFDFGGFQLFSVGSSCQWPSMNTYITTPSGASVAYTGTFDKPYPFTPGKYTAVTFGPGGTNVYVGGRRWMTSPVVQWPYSENEPFTMSSAKFYGGNMLNTNMTIHDIQIYYRELSVGEIGGLQRGLSAVC